MKKLIRFDWAIKKLLRNKVNFGIMEGFLSELLKVDIRIEAILESESNKESAEDKSNRVDILVKNTDGELMLIEVQNNAQIDYFHRMIFGISKLISEYIKDGEAYGTIRKAISINIVYFDLGQGDDYVYEYEGHFVGRHQNDVLLPSPTQQVRYNIARIADLFPRYFILKINNFDNNARDTLDEWIYFLKNSEIQDDFQAKGLQEAGEKLRIETLSDGEKAAYVRFREDRRIELSVLETAKFTAEMKGREEGLEEGREKGREEGREKGLEEGREKEKIEIASNLKKSGVDYQTISAATGLSEDEISRL